jgi:hypothetical protein
MIKKALLLSSLIVLGAATSPAMARVNLNVDIGVPPPADQVEVVPTMRAGYVWAPGYWDYRGGRHVWVKGHSMRGRSGYHWTADRWVERDGRHHLERGRWER